MPKAGQEQQGLGDAVDGTSSQCSEKVNCWSPELRSLHCGFLRCGTAVNSCSASVSALQEV